MGGTPMPRDAGPAGFPNAFSAAGVAELVGSPVRRVVRPLTAPPFRSFRPPRPARYRAAMPLDALIFDLDGTLIDSNNLHVEAFRRALAGLGYKVPADRIFVEIGKGGDNVVPALIGKEGDERDGEALRAAAPKHFAELAAAGGIRAFPGATELLAEARRRGLRTALATSSSKKQLATASEHSGVDWASLVDEVVLADDVGTSKPAPDAVAAAVAKLKLSPAQCAMVGDTSYDAEAARHAGVVCLGVESGGHTAAELMHTGARRVWRDAAHLLTDLDNALRAASPTSLRLTHAAMEKLMREALAAAEAGLAAGEAPIGCVLCRGDGSVLASGFNSLNATKDRTAHAEMVAFRAAAKLVPPDADDLILVSTLEPCVMCLGAAMEAAVDTVIYGLKAPADSGTGRLDPPASPEAQMPRIVGDVLAGESRRLFERFLKRPDINPKQAAYVRQLLATAP
jgi:HAD superfamily hydrolase (TIGR01509 family)